MDRKEFLALIGLTAGGLVLASQLSSCQKTNTTPLNVDFVLNLTDSANAALNTNGGYLFNQGVIVARTMTGAYIAVAAACTHQGRAVEYDGTNNMFHCPAHGSNFSNSGGVINGPASSPLQQFKTTLTGTLLRVNS